MSPKPQREPGPEDGMPSIRVEPREGDRTPVIKPDEKAWPQYLPP
ncbi:MAG: hypothetical protein R2688_01215 [Fimbriimonadaceae bacterium]